MWPMGVWPMGVWPMGVWPMGECHGESGHILVKSLPSLCLTRMYYISPHCDQWGEM